HELANEGILEVSLVKTISLLTTQGILQSPAGIPHHLGVYFKDGTYTNIAARENIPWGTPKFSLSFDLSGLKNVDYYSIAFQGGRTLGGYTISTSNPTYLNQANFLTDEEIAQLQIESRVNGFDLGQALAFQTGNFLYTNQYGQMETHNPEEFFTRLFRNKYEQEAGPIQIARGLELLNNSNDPNVEGVSQFDFLTNFVLDNAILSVGPYNYTYNLAIPNVPLDASAFAETALVYSALIGRAPTKTEVAILTLTPKYELRPLMERAKMIMEMPDYAGRYGLAMMGVFAK
ncbi:MAG: hypothetical protein VW907_06200, partial [Opitutae bacterium]